MSKYYCLIAGLPQIALEDSKQTYSVAGFRSEIDSVLTKRDKKIIDIFFLKYDNKNLIAYLKNQDCEFDTRGTFSAEEYKTIISAFKDEEPVPRKNRLPSYMIDFLKMYVESGIKGDNAKISWEDRLAALYFSFAMKSKNKFVAEWYELNLNINNMLTAITCRKYDLDKARYIVGDNIVADALRKSGARDFGLSDEVDYLPSLSHIAEEKDLMAREKRIDLLKWNWLEDNTFFKTFDIESVFAYMLKLEMVERWVTLDKEAGEKTFREIVGIMKKGSKKALDEFKRNNEK